MYLEKLPKKITEKDIVIKLLEGEKAEIKTSGGIILTPATERPEKLKKAEVVMVGNKNGFCKVGDIVAYNKNAGSDLIINGEDYLLINEEIGIFMIL